MRSISRTRLWRAALFSATVSSSLTPGLAVAQSGLEPPTPFELSDRFGVDMISGAVSVSSPAISVGDPARGGLAFMATWDSKAAGWRYSNWGQVKKEIAKDDRYCLGLYNVVFMGSAKLFQRDSCTASTFSAIDGDGELVRTATGYTYKALDGSVAVYTGPLNQASVTSITRPNGEVLTYSYSGANLSSVTNNYGYQLHFEYAGSSLSKVVAINNAVDACGLTAATCSYSTTWPSLTFSGTTNLRSVTDNLGRTTRIGLGGVALDRVETMSRPSNPSGSSVTYTYSFIPCGGYRVTAVTDGSGTWTYSYDVNAPAYGAECPPLDWDNQSTTVTDPAGGTTTYYITYSGRIYWTGDLVQEPYLTPAIYAIKDPLNQTTQISQNGQGFHGAVYPEGNSVSVTRNEVGAVTEIRTVAKPASGIPDISVSGIYPDCSAQPLLCHFPTTTTDARGGVTDYTYDAAGNLLTVTGPAPTAGAARPRTVYTWEQRYAWYKQNGSSAITQASSPVWVMTSQYSCMTGATC